MRKRKEKMSEGKRNIIASLIEEYDIQSAEDTQDALKDLLGATIESMLKAELDNHLGYEPYERNESSNSRNGSKSKMVRSKCGQLQIDDIYGFEISDGMVSDITDKLLPKIHDWQQRPLSEVYPILFIDAVHFSADVRKVIYTTNAIESLNSSYRRLNRQRSVFPSEVALLKALYLATFQATKKWTLPLRNWGKVYGELSIMYEGRL